MRMTVTLADDVAAKLDRERRKRGILFKALVNEVLRAGFKAMSRTEGFDLGSSLVTR